MAYSHAQAGVIETISHDAVLIALRLSNVLVPSSFIGAKVVGTSILIGTHLFG
jgi:hypothetical protein